MAEPARSEDLLAEESDLPDRGRTLLFEIDETEDEVNSSSNAEPNDQANHNMNIDESLSTQDLANITEMSEIDDLDKTHDSERTEMGTITVRAASGISDDSIVDDMIVSEKDMSTTDDDEPPKIVESTSQYIPFEDGELKNGIIGAENGTAKQDEDAKTNKLHKKQLLLPTNAHHQKHSNLMARES